MSKLQDELIRSERYNKVFSIVMADIDKFKNVNDTYGHNAGDNVLKADGEFFQTNIRQVDIVLPWMVQRFSPLLHNDMDRYRDIILDDISWCKANGVDYVPCVTPGFSWHNLSRQSARLEPKPVNSIPRLGGKFYWQQISTAIVSGAEMLFKN